MITIRIGDVVVECDTVMDAAVLLERFTPKPVGLRINATDTDSLRRALHNAKLEAGPPPLRKVKPREKGVPKEGAGRKGRPAIWTSEELRDLSARIQKGERLDVLAGENGKPAVRLYQALSRAGLPTKFTKATTAPEVPVRRLAPGHSGLEEAAARKRA